MTTIKEHTSQGARAARPAASAPATSITHRPAHIHSGPGRARLAGRARARAAAVLARTARGPLAGNQRQDLSTDQFQVTQLRQIQQLQAPALNPCVGESPTLISDLSW